MTDVSCSGWARQNPGQFRHVLRWSVFFGVTLAVLLQLFVYVTRPPIPHLAPGESVKIEAVGDGGYMLTLHYLSARSAWCTRQVGELMTTENGEWAGKQMPGYLGLAFNQNGPGMYYGVADEYVLYRYIPPGVPKGQWQYLVRVRHECAPWGLIHWTSSSAPYEIVIP